MSATKWTPGPWESTKVNWDRCVIRHALAGPEHVPGYIAEVNNIGSSFPANTRLIAAAPELYEALEEMVRWHGKREPALATVSGGEGLLPMEQQDEEVQAAMRALAKARGDA